MTNVMSYALMKAGYDVSNYDSWILNLPPNWRRYTSSNEIPYREGLQIFQTLYAGYKWCSKKIETAIEENSDIDRMYLLCEIEDGNFDNFILKNTPRLDVYLPPGSTSNTLQREVFECMNRCLVEKNKILELSQKIANLNGKPTKTALRKWLYLDQEVRKQIKTDPVKALSYFIDSHYGSSVENQRILEENRVLNEKQKAAKSLEDDFFKLQQKNLEIQKKRAKELDELHCVKGQLDKLKQDASRLWKEKEYFKRELQANDISVLQHQIAEEKAKVLELTNKIQSLSKEKENLLTRLSEVAGCKLTSNNPAITDLSDENRPFKLAEKFSQLYDDEWTDSLEEITSIGIDEETSISFLLNVVMTAFQLCYRQTMLLSLKDCRTVMWCDSPNLKVLHEMKLPDAAKFEVERTIKRCSHSGQRDYISSTQKKFHDILNDMLRDLAKKKNHDNVSSMNHQSNHCESNKVGEQREKNDGMDSKFPTKPKISRSLSTGNVVIGWEYTKNTDYSGMILCKEKEIAQKFYKRYKNRLAESARGDFSKPCYEKYIQEGFLLDKESIEELLLGPIKRFAKTAQFADHCVELCSSMRSIQPPVHLSASIPENRELKHDVFKAYTKSGKVIDYIVWPAMYLHEKGPLLSKGVAQPK